VRPEQSQVVITDPGASDHLPVAVRLPVPSEHPDSPDPDRSAHGENVQPPGDRAVR
jgi:hypothetical protein